MRLRGTGAGSGDEPAGTANGESGARVTGPRGTRAVALVGGVGQCSSSPSVLAGTARGKRDCPVTEKATVRSRLLLLPQSAAAYCVCPLHHPMSTNPPHRTEHTPSLRDEQPLLLKRRIKNKRHGLVGLQVFFFRTHKHIFLKEWVP